MNKKLKKLEKKVMKLEIKWLLKKPSKPKERAKYNLYLAQIKNLKGGTDGQ